MSLIRLALPSFVLSAFTLVCVFVLLSNGVSAKEAPMSGTIVVVNKLGDNVTFIDLESRSVIKQLPTGKGPHELAMTHDGKWAVTTDYVGGNSLTVFDVENVNVARTISLKDYPRPHGIVFLTDQQHVAVSSEGSDTAVVVNIHNGEIVSAIGTEQKGSHMVAVADASNVIYTTNMHDDTVSVLDVGAAKLSKNIPMAETPEAITVSRDGKFLWVGSNKDGLVTIYDTQGFSQLKQWPGYTFPYRILLTPDQKFAVVPDYRQDTLDIFDVKTTSKIKRIQLDKGTGPKGVVFHPNNKTLFLSAYSQDRILAVDIPSGKILFELPTGDGPDGIGFSMFVHK